MVCTGTITRGMGTVGCWARRLQSWTAQQVDKSHCLYIQTLELCRWVCVALAVVLCQLNSTLAHISSCLL
jgi:hypothetical protein